MKRKEEPLDGVVRRLDVLIGLLIESRVDGPKSSTASKIYRLTDLGLSPAEVGSIIGKGSNYVGAVLGSRKKSSKGKVEESAE
jgi:hypothetical protein